MQAIYQMIGAVVAFFAQTSAQFQLLQLTCILTGSMQFCFLSIKAGNLMFKWTFHVQELHTICSDLKVSITLDLFFFVFFTSVKPI